MDFNKVFGNLLRARKKAYFANLYGNALATPHLEWLFSLECRYMMRDRFGILPEVPNEDSN